MSYNFLNLSPMEFEQLCHDLLEPKLKIDLEIFTEGIDGGIDLRYNSESELIIVQCKRYSDYDNLLSSLKSEIPKVHKLKPTRYIITTSVGLTVNRKELILKMFSPFINSTE